MLDIRYNGVNIYNPIEGQIDNIINYFVKFYGEDKRDVIEEKIKNTTFLFVSKNKGLMSDLNFFLHSNLIGVIDANINKLCKKYKLPEIKGTTFINAAEQVRFSRNRLARGEMVNDAVSDNFAKTLGIKHGVKEATPKQKQRILNFMDLFLNEYDEKYQSVVDETIAKIKQASSKINEIMPNFIEIEQKEQEFIRDYKYKYFNRLIRKTGVTLEKDKEEFYFNAFSKMIDYSEDSKIIPSFLDEDFNELFKALGSKEKFWKDDKNLLSLVYDSELLSDIQLCKDRAEETIKKNNKSFVAAIEILENLDYAYDKDKAALIKCVENFLADEGVIGFASNYLDSSGKLKSVCICTDYITLATPSLVHELQHIIDTSLLRDYDEYYAVKSGLDLCAFSKVDKVAKDKHYFYQCNCEGWSMLDEILTEYLAQKVYGKMIDECYSVGLNRNIGSIYQKGFYVFNKIFADNEKFWINARNSTSPYIANRFIGESDFELLAKAATTIINEDVEVSLAINEIETKMKRKITYQNAYMCEKLLGKYDFSENAEKFIKIIKSVNIVNEKLKRKIKNTAKTHDICCQK